MKIEYYTKYIKVYIAPYADNKLIENLENSIEWLSNKLSIQLRGRIPFYHKKISEYEKYRGYVNEDMFYILSSFSEIFLISRIVEQLQKHDSKEFIETLKKIVKGNNFRGESENDTARNFIFELLIASDFQENNFYIDLSTKTDIVVFEPNILIECKRIQSEKKLIERINEGINQINDRNTGEYNGIVFIDISELIDISKRIIIQVPLENTLTLLTNLIDTDLIVDKIIDTLDLEVKNKIFDDMNKINNLIKNKKVTIVLVCNFLGFHHGLVKEDLIIGQRFYTFGSNAKDILDKMYLVNI